MWLSRCRLWRWLLACFIILLIANIWFVPWTKITKHGKVTNSYEQQLQATRKARSFQDIQREKYDTIVHRNTSESNKKSIRSSADDFSKEFEINIKLGRWDSNQRFKYFDFVVIGDRFEELSDMYSVSLATQSSLERLYSLAEVSHHWTAAISVSVFIVGEDFFLTEIYISYLRQCFTEVRERVTFHLAYSSEYPAASDYPSLVVNRTQNCSHPKQVLSELVALRSPETVDWLNSYEYPQNHLRNHARKNCQTPYVFLTDVDIIPSTGMADALDIFLTQQNHTNLCAYVIPAYELHDSVTFPENKSEILQIIEKGLARPFRRMVYKNGHFPTNYEKWESDVKEEVHVCHVVTGCPKWYEPFYVALNTVPIYDERFIGYGFTRNTQVHEMLAAGYKFQVLSPVFACHWGFSIKSVSYTNARVKQLRTNTKKIKQFRNEISSRYPNTAKMIC